MRSRGSSLVSDGSLPFAKNRTPEYPETEARGKLSRKDRARLCLSQNGRCAGCGIKPRYGWEFDHIDELWEGGTNALSNWQAFGSRRDCKCHAVKTAQAARRRAKMHRLRGDTGQVKRRKERGSKLKSRNTFAQPSLPMRLRTSREPGKILSAGFRKHKTLVRGVDGKVKERR